MKTQGLFCKLARRRAVTLRALLLGRDFSEKYFPAHKKQAALQEIFNFVQTKEESLTQAWGRIFQLLNACLIILLRKMKYLISFIMD